MRNFITKLIVCPLIVYLSSVLFRSVYYYTIFQAVLTGVIIAFVATIMDMFLLRKKTTVLSTILDFLGAFAIVYISGFVARNAVITFWGAVWTALLLAAAEYIIHRSIVARRERRDRRRRDLYPE